MRGQEDSTGWGLPPHLLRVLRRASPGAFQGPRMSHLHSSPGQAVSQDVVEKETRGGAGQMPLVSVLSDVEDALTAKRRLIRSL